MPAFRAADAGATGPVPLAARGPPNAPPPALRSSPSASSGTASPGDERRPIHSSSPGLSPLPSHPAALLDPQRAASSASSLPSTIQAPAGRRTGGASRGGVHSKRRGAFHTRTRRAGPRAALCAAPASTARLQRRRGAARPRSRPAAQDMARRRARALGSAAGPRIGGMRAPPALQLGRSAGADPPVPHGAALPRPRHVVIACRARPRRRPPPPPTTSASACQRPDVYFKPP
jgi:hypothetical protein